MLCSSDRFTGRTSAWAQPPALVATRTNRAPRASAPAAAAPQLSQPERKQLGELQPRVAALKESVEAAKSERQQVGGWVGGSQLSRGPGSCSLLS